MTVEIIDKKKRFTDYEFARAVTEAELRGYKEGINDAIRILKK